MFVSSTFFLSVVDHRKRRPYRGAFFTSASIFTIFFTNINHLYFFFKSLPQSGTAPFFFREIPLYGTVKIQQRTINFKTRFDDLILPFKSNKSHPLQLEKPCWELVSGKVFLASRSSKYTT